MGVGLKANVFLQVVTKAALRQLKQRFVILDNFLTSGETLIAGRCKINLPRLFHGAVPNCPHSENESQPCVFSPEPGHVPDLQAFTRKCHSRIPNYQCCIILLELLVKVSAMLCPLGITLQ